MISLMDASAEAKRAIGVLLLKMVEADGVVRVAEMTCLYKLLTEHFGFAPAEAQHLSAKPGQQPEKSTENAELKQLATLVRSVFSPEQLTALMGDMWTVAFSDLQLTSEEDDLCWRACDLLGVPRFAAMGEQRQAAKSFNWK